LLASQYWRFFRDNQATPATASGYLSVGVQLGVHSGMDAAGPSLTIK
jgi:hypothetical protein